MSTVPLRRLGGLLVAGATALGPLLVAIPATSAAVGDAPVAVLAAADPVTSCGGGSCTATYSATGAVQTFTVPDGVTTVTVTLFGGSGGDVVDDQGDGSTDVQGGFGGRSTAAVDVRPGAVLDLVVGGAGATSRPGDAVDGRPGGYGGGGSGGNGFDIGLGRAAGGPGGGGGSFLFDDAGILQLVAGGGGGAGSDGSSAGGAGGGAGAPAGSGTGAAGGGAGTQDAHGAGGASTESGFPGTAGQGASQSAESLPAGGSGGSAGVFAVPGGGGGGGYFAGGGGAAGGLFGAGAGAGAGGGGGSGYAGPSVNGIEGAAGVKDGDGTATITYADPGEPAAVDVTLGVGRVAVGKRQGVAVSGLVPGAPVVVTDAGRRVSPRSAKADRRGRYGLTWRVSGPVGRHRVVVTSRADGRSGVDTYRVTRR